MKSNVTLVDIFLVGLVSSMWYAFCIMWVNLRKNAIIFNYTNLEHDVIR